MTRVGESALWGKKYLTSHLPGERKTLLTEAIRTQHPSELPRHPQPPRDPAHRPMGKPAAVGAANHAIKMGKAPSQWFWVTIIFTTEMNKWDKLKDNKMSRHALWFPNVYALPCVMTCKCHHIECIWVKSGFWKNFVIIFTTIIVFLVSRLSTYEWL